MNFASDTAAPAHPAILHALAVCNAGPAASYGADSLSEEARLKLCEVFETDLDAYLVSSGTAANALALALQCPPTAAVLCHAEAHIERDERGAPEFFTGGGKLALLGGPDAKITPEALEARLKLDQPDFVHETPLACLSLSNLTESGAVYTAGEIAALASLAHAHGLRVHLDGARFANAVVAAGARPADLSWKAGVDVMSFGATKNGALGCEAVLLFGDSRAMGRELRIRAKRAGHMPPKMRFLAAQMTAYLDGGRWLELARRANESAQALADVFSRAGHPLRRPADGNEVFVDLTPAASEALSRAGARFYPWIDGSFRFVCSWATPPEEIAALAEALPPA